MNNTICDFPYYNVNNECILYKDVVGSSYDNTMISFLFFSILGMLLSLVLVIYSYFRDEKKFTIRHGFIFLLFISFTLLMVQFTDPFGFGGIISHASDVFLSDFSTWFSMIVVFSIVITFTSIFNNFKENKYLRYQIGGIILSVIITIVTSFLQIYVDRSTWRGVKLIMMAVFGLYLLYWLNHYIKASIILSVGCSVDRIHRLYDSVTIFNIFFSIIITFQLIIGINSLQSDDMIQPVINFNKLVLPIFHLACNYFGIIYFSKIKCRREHIQLRY